MVLPLKPNFEFVVSKADKPLRRRNEFGFKSVAGYRLYCLDGADKVASAEWIDADSDEAAIEVAKGMMNGQPCELWQRSRLVIRLERGAHS